MLWQFLLGIFLLILSALLYLLHFTIFQDAHHIFIYLLGDIAFIPIEVLIVTLIIHQLLEHRAKRSKFKKLNMIIGAFFSEVGTQLLTYLSDCDPELEKIKQELVVKGDWNDKQFKEVARKLKKHQYQIEIKKLDLVVFKNVLLPKRDFLIRLLENQNVLEHEDFTGLLWATFHLADELSVRKDLKSLSHADAAHIAIDLKRVYLSLVIQWVAYMKHLKIAYPYLFSLAIRINPFDESASPEVTGS